MRRAAIKSLLSQKVRDGEITVVQEFVLPALKTQEVLKALAGLSIATSTKCLVVNNANTQKDLWQVCHNLQRVKSIPAATLNTVDLLNYDHLVLSVEAIRRIEELWAEERPRLPMRRAIEASAVQGGE
jgi:large subunit ribosomal protein L4